MRDYGKVFSTFWTSDSTRGLSDDGKMLALYLLTGPHSNIIGCYRLPDGYVSEDLGWDITRVSEGFGELFRKGFATRENDSKWVFVSKYLKWNPLENPNQITGALKLFDQIPDTSSVKSLMATALREYTKPDLKGYGTLPKPLPNPSETLSKPGSGSGSEDKNNTSCCLSPAEASDDDNPPPGEDKSNGKTPAESFPDCPHQRVIDLYHEILPELPKVRKWDGARATHLKARWREIMQRLKVRGDPCTLEAGLEWWRKFFLTRVRPSPLLMGKVSRPNGSAWCASLDWLVKAENHAKTFEGQYLERRAA